MPLKGENGGASLFKAIKFRFYNQIKMNFRFAKQTQQAATRFVKTEPLYYHSTPFPGKLTVKTTKPMNTIKDLSLAYSPGVAEPCLEIAKNKQTVYDTTS